MNRHVAGENHKKMSSGQSHCCLALSLDCDLFRPVLGTAGTAPTPGVTVMICSLSAGTRGGGEERRCEDDGRLLEPRELGCLFESREPGRLFDSRDLGRAVSCLLTRIDLRDPVREGIEAASASWYEDAVR